MSHTTFQVGRLRCHALEAGRQALDGGAMFGVVPKPLWQRRIPADERNRITLALRCLLIEHDDGLVLVDTGLGNKEDAKFKDIYGVANEGKGGRTCLEDALAEIGRAPADVRWVINTHLHFDHAGGNTFREVVEVVEGPFASRFRGPPTSCSGESSSSPGTPTSARRRATSRPISSRCRSPWCPARLRRSPASAACPRR